MARIQDEDDQDQVDQDQNDPDPGSGWLGSGSRTRKIRILLKADPQLLSTSSHLPNFPISQLPLLLITTSSRDSQAPKRSALRFAPGLYHNMSLFMSRENVEYLALEGSTTLGNAGA